MPNTQKIEQFCLEMFQSGAGQNHFSFESCDGMRAILTPDPIVNVNNLLLFAILPVPSFLPTYRARWRDRKVDRSEKIIFSFFLINTTTITLYLLEHSKKSKQLHHHHHQSHDVTFCLICDFLVLTFAILICGSARSLFRPEFEPSPVTFEARLISHRPFNL